MTTGTRLTKKDGVDEYALYIEMVQYSRTSPATPDADPGVRFTQHVRCMLFRDQIYIYARSHGKKASRWRTMARSNFDSALATMEKQLSQLGSNANWHVEMRGEPLLLQVRPTDIEQYEQNNVPDIRYAGMSHLDAVYGKLTDDAEPQAPLSWLV